MAVKAIVLAAGQGTRMKSELPKVLHEAAGLPLVGWVVDAVAAAGAADIAVVIGHGAGAVAAALPDGVVTAVQEEQLGTAHAAAVGLEALDVAGDDQVLVVPGDMPLLRAGSLVRALEAQRTARAVVVTTVLDDPAGYGRIVRDDAGRVTGIVEHRDATEEQRAITEVNTGVYVLAGEGLADLLDRVEQGNVQGEYYLTDVVGLLTADGASVAAVLADPEEGMGVNSHAQLADVAAVLRRRINRAWMDAGVWMQDPDRVYLDASVQLEPGARLYPGVHLEGATTVAAGAEVGPEVFAVDSAVGRDARVWYAVLRGAAVGAGVQVGPYASLRPGAVLRDRAKAGTFVEIKESTVGEGSKVPHLSYIGDATIGVDSNIGAGTVTVNYDGYRKHRTVIGDRVKIGSDTMLVAPVEVGDEAYTGAGSVITQDVAPGSLAVERSAQKEVPGYAERRKRRAEEGRS
jgi:bifunctional UDP-N-acetylglucosamine pyrophosphorylase / glucosamine-1-phosphate N-acetyltransferase